MGQIHAYDAATRRCRGCDQLWPCQSILATAGSLEERMAADRREQLANDLYVAVVQPDTIWWDDLTPDMQEHWLRAADVAKRHFQT